MHQHNMSNVQTQSPNMLDLYGSLHIFTMFRYLTWVLLDYRFRIFLNMFTNWDMNQQIC